MWVNPRFVAAVSSVWAVVNVNTSEFLPGKNSPSGGYGPVCPRKQSFRNQKSFAFCGPAAEEQQVKIPEYWEVNGS